jgi:hypothetical protein
MKRVHKHLGYANLAATLALFLGLSGGTALAAYLVASNADIGPDTIAGHNPPTGDHSNLIAGSINEPDVKAKSLTDKSISERTLTGDALKIAYIDQDAGATKTIASIGGYTIKNQCTYADRKVVAHIYANGPQGTANWMAGRTENDAADLGTDSRGVWLQASTDTELMSVDAADGQYDRLAGTLMLNSGLAGPTLVQVNFNVIANGVAGSCFIVGTATRAT